MSRLQAWSTQPAYERENPLAVWPDTGLVLADVSKVHLAATSYEQAAAQTDGMAAAARDQVKRLKHGASGQVASQGLTPLMTEPYHKIGWG
jgi:hypothetical protein